MVQQPTRELATRPRRQPLDKKLSRAQMVLFAFRIGVRSSQKAILRPVLLGQARLYRLTLRVEAGRGRKRRLAQPRTRRAQDKRQAKRQAAHRKNSLKPHQA